MNTEPELEILTKSDTYEHYEKISVFKLLSVKIKYI